MAARHEEEVFTALTRLAFAGDGLVFGFGMTVLAIRTWLKFWTHSKALQEIKETPVTRIADIRTLADESDGQLREEIKLPKKLFKLHEKETTSSKQHFEVFATKSKVKMPSRPWMGIQPPTPPSEPKHQKLVIVRGRVQTQASVESEDVKTDADALVAHNVSEKAVFIERTQTFVHTDLSSFLGWITQKDLVKFSHQMVPFVLAETEAPWNLRPRNAAIYVHINLDDSHHPMPLLTVHHQLHPVTASSYTLFQAMFGRRYPVGLLDEEKILPIGAEITAVGVLQTAPDGTPVVKASNRVPIFLTEFTREQLLVELAKGTKVLFWMSLAVSTVAAGVLGYSMVKNWVKWKQRQQQRRSQNNESSQERVIDDEVENLEDIPDGELCVVCFLRRRRAAFIHCGHRVCCVGCAQRVEHGNNPRCPVCRQSVSGIVRVYDS